MSTYTSDQVRMIPIDLLDPHPDNPRKHLGDLTDLTASIKANGLLSPLSVTPHDDRYRVIAGHRRLAASQQAGLAELPAFILDLTPLQQLEAMITENTQREQLTVLEEADAIQGMLQLGATIHQTARQLGRSDTYVRERRRIAGIGDRVRGSREGFAQLSFSELMAIAEFDGDLEAQKRLAKAAGGNGFGWLLDHLRTERKRRAWVGKAGEALAGLGLTSLPAGVALRNSWNDPSGYGIVASFRYGDPFAVQWEAWRADHETDGLFVHLFEDDAVVVAYRAKRKTDPEESYEERARREARERRERERPVREFHERSRRLRERWAGGTLFQVDGGRLADMVAGLLRLSVFLDHGYRALARGLDYAACDRAIESYNRIREHDPLPDTAKDPKHGAYHLDTERNFDELRERCRRSPAELACWMCAIVEARITWTDWMTPTPMVRDYYRILTDAGYPVSDEERQALAVGMDRKAMHATMTTETEE